MCILTEIFCTYFKEKVVECGMRNKGIPKALVRAEMSHYIYMQLKMEVSY